MICPTSVSLSILVFFGLKMSFLNSEFPSWTIKDLEDGAEIKMRINALNAKGTSEMVILDAHMPIAHQQSVISKKIKSSIN